MESNYESTHADEIFVGRSIRLDGKRFEDCTFTRCHIAFHAERKPIALHGCTFDSCTWHFRGAARDTVTLLRMIAGSNGGEELLSDVIFGEPDDDGDE